MITSTFKLEEELLKSGYDFVIGIDEAGRGPLAGPVVASACILKSSSPFPSSVPRRDTFSRREKGDLIDLIRDSKTLSYKQRESLFDFIQENFYVGVGICDHETIDRMNILEASFLAMKKAVSDLMRNLKNYKKNEETKICHSRATPRQRRGSADAGSRESGNPINGLDSGSRIKYGMTLSDKYIILLDGNKPIPNFSAEQKAIVNGDKIVKSISAASIIAKVTRDRIMLAMHEKYPEYGFHKHKGYGTKLHFEMLQKHGPCKIHRRSFKPVSKFAKRKF